MMAAHGTTKEKNKVKKEGVQETTDMTRYHNASVQTTVSVCTKEQRVLEKKKKKKIKQEKVEANDFTLRCDASAQTTIKTEPGEINSSKGKQEKNDLPQKEKKKRKQKEEESEHFKEEVMDISINEAGEKLDREHLEGSRLKKAKKKRKTEIEVNVFEADKIKKKKKKLKAMVREEAFDVSNNGEIEKKKKKEKKKMTEEQNPEAEEEQKKKKKKTKKRDACREEEETKKKEKATSLKSKHDVEVEEEKNVKLKKKSLPHKDSIDEVNVSTDRKKTSNKRKKKLELVNEDPPKEKMMCDVIAGVRSSDEKMSKNINIEVHDVMEMVERKQVEKKKSKKDKHKFLGEVKNKRVKEDCKGALKESSNDERTDVVFLSEKQGNQDEVSIDQVRRLALQKDIDEESQPKLNLGQWGTAQFDSSDKQAKFLRLMGGFKKSSQPITGSSGRTNMALGKEGQQTLQQSLLGEFELAQSRHMNFRNKGTGLGFTAPSNKKFAIDANARNSIRFDD